jgi:hypothetical protein
MEARISSLQAELQSVQTGDEDQTQEINSIKASHDALAAELSDANMQLEKMEDLQKQADHMTALLTQCGDKDRSLSTLKDENDQLKSQNEQLSSYQRDTQDKALEIVELRKKLKSVEEASQEIIDIRRELDECKQNDAGFEDAQAKIISLESELARRDEQLKRFQTQITDFEMLPGQLEQLTTQLSVWKNNCESLELKLKATEAECDRTQILEQEMSTRDCEVQTLKRTLAEAEGNLLAASEMQIQVVQFRETIARLSREAEDAQKVSEELQSVKAAKSDLQQSLTDLESQLVTLGQARTATRFQENQIEQKDAYIAELQKQLSHLDTGSQRGEKHLDGDAETNLDRNGPETTCPTVADAALQRQSTEPGGDGSKLAEVANKTFDEETEPRKKKECANRNGTNISKSVPSDYAGLWDWKDSAPMDLAISTLPWESIGAGASTHSKRMQTELEPNIIPESQPSSNDQAKRSLEHRDQSEQAQSCISSSPLSDIGDLFDSSFLQEVLGIPQDDDVREGWAQGLNIPVEIDVAADRGNLQEKTKPKDEKVETRSSHQSRHRAELAAETQPPSSSCGEPLLLDDLEGPRLLSASSTTGADSRKPSTSSNQDILTSPPEGLGRKVFPKHGLAAGSSKNLARPTTKTIGLLEYGQCLARDTSPQRQHRHERSLQTVRQPFSEAKNVKSSNKRPTTPEVLYKEKHQPNSAVKRKSDVAGLGEDVRPKARPRGSRNLSNVDLHDQPLTNSRPAESVTSERSRQSSSSLRHSLISNAKGRGRVRGGLASGNSKQGPKRARGGSKSELFPVILPCEDADSQRPKVQ